jgi:hypothetical protein
MTTITKRGYAGLAREMATDRGMDIFKNFKELGVRNLLYLQSELAHLERELASLSETYPSAGGDDLTRQDATQKQKMEEIKVKLREYSESF